jgi:hypothetical protein
VGDVAVILAASCFACVVALVVAMVALCSKRAEAANERNLLMAQYEETLRHLAAQNGKLVEQLMVLMDRDAYVAYRAASTKGVPPGSVSPVRLHVANGERLPQNGAANRAVDAAVERVARQVLAEDSGLRPIANPSDVDRGSALP